MKSSNLNKIRLNDTHPKKASWMAHVGSVIGAIVTASTALAAIPADKIPSMDVAHAVPGSTIQKVEDIPDQSQLSFRFNNLLSKEYVNLPGWNAATGNIPDKPALLHAFAVRTKIDATPLQPGEASFFAGRGVGRSGIWELEHTGQNFAVINGRPLKGLTIKGYGGNTASNRPQPDGSMVASEAYRDMLLSELLMEKGVDTYIGAITIVRPTAAQINSNFIRLSRSSLRLNDIIDRTGPELESTVDHLTNLLTDEVGHKMTPEAFTIWLIKRSATTLAGKEQARVKSSNNNKDNFGIAELVDFGEANYSPLTYVPGSDSKLGGTSWSSSLGDHVVTAANKLAAEYKFTIDAPGIYNETYQRHFDALEAHELARVDLEKASESDLLALGLSKSTVNKILAIRELRPFGLLTPAEVFKIGASTPERKILMSRTTTSFLRLSNGLSLANVIVDEIGGAKGLRSVITGLLMDLGPQMSDPAALGAKFKEAFVAHLKNRGVDMYQDSARSYGAHTQELLDDKITELATKDPTFVARELKRLPESRAFVCRGLFE